MFEHLTILLNNDNFKGQFDIQDIGFFLAQCKAAYDCLSDNPIIQKLSRKQWGYSFLQIENHVYVISKRCIGKGTFGYVKLAACLDQPISSLFTVKIQCSEHPIKKNVLNIFEHELKIGRYMNFFKQETLFLRKACGKASQYDKVYMVAPYRGQSLRDWLRRSPSAEVRLRIAFKLCLSIHQIHANGLVHRDLKNNNIVIDANENVTVIDYGISSQNIASNEITRYGGLWYLPTSSHDGCVTKENVSNALRLVEQMGRLNADTFALKRILWMPYAIGKSESLLDEATLSHLPILLQRMVDTMFPDQVYKRQDTPLEMATRFALAIFDLTAMDLISQELQQSAVQIVQQAIHLNTTQAMCEAKAQLLALGFKDFNPPFSSDGRSRVGAHESEAPKL